MARHPYAIAATLALLVRLVLLFARHTYIFDSPDPFAFGMESGSIARSVAAGEGFSSPFRGSTGPTAWIAPLYPYLCALIFRFFGIYSHASAACMLAINSLASALTCFAIGGIARRTVGERVGVISAFVWALLPHFAKWPTEWVWDMAASALLVACVWWLTLLLAAEPSRRNWLAFGALWAVITLTNPSLLTLLPISAIWLAVRSREGRFWRHAGAAALVCAVLVMPWMARNRAVMGRWVFVRDNFGFEFHLGNYHGSNGMGWRGLHPAVNPAEYERYRRLGELQYIAQTGRAAREFVAAYPDEFLRLCATRAAAFWDGTSLLFDRRPAPWTVATFAGFSLIALFGLLWATAKRVPGVALFWWIPLYPLPYYITYPQPRYRHAVEPEMLLLAVFFLSSVAAGVHGALRSRAAKKHSAALA